jgi:hypothetical protein
MGIAQCATVLSYAGRGSTEVQKKQQKMKAQNVMKKKIYSCRVFFLGITPASE